MESGNQLTTPMKVSKMLVLLALSGITAWQIYRNVLIYLKYEAVTTISKEPADIVKFPSVTICNYNRWKLSLQTTSGIAGYYGAVAAQAASASNKTSNSSKVANIDMYDYTNMTGWHLVDRYNRGTLSQLRNDTLMSCTFGGQSCNTKFFKHRMTHYGNCYTFNDALKESDINDSTFSSQLTLPLSQTYPSESGGLELYINVEAFDYTESVSAVGKPLVGIKVIIHPEGEPPDPTKNGISLSPGNFATVGIKRMEYHAVSPPYGECDPDRKLKYFDTYTIGACAVECRMNKIMNKCSCRPWYLPQIDSSRQCDMTELMLCVIPAMNNINSNFSRYCSCPEPCDYEDYAASVSYGLFPSSSMAADLALLGGFSTVDAYKQNVVGLKIYFNQIGSDVISQSPANTPISILNDMGGTLGLYLGVSIFTFFEIVEYAMVLIRSFMKNKKNAVKHANERQVEAPRKAFEEQ